MQQLLENRAENNNQNGGRNDDAGDCQQRAAPAEQTVADPDRHVFDVDARQCLRNGEAVQKIFFTDPVAILDEFAQEPAAQAASEAGEPDTAEDQEKPGEGGRPTRVG